MHRRNTIGEILQSIDKVNVGLVAPTERIEKVFLDTGAELSECAMLLQQVMRQFEDLPRLFSSESLTVSSRQLAHVGERALEIAEEMKRAGGDLERLSASLGEAEMPVDSLRRTAKMMGIVATNARVGSETLAEKSGGFGAFADDVSALSGSMAATVTDFFNTYEQLNYAVADVAIAQAHFVVGQLEPLTVAANSLTKSLDALTAQRLDIVTKSADTSRRSREIYMHLGETVIALQSGDAVRQRLEHVCAALSKIGAAGLGRGVIHRLLELQQRQLQGAREMLGQEIGSAESNVVQLGQDVQLLLENSRYVQGGGGKSALGALRRVVQETVSVLNHCETERQRLDTIVADVSQAVKRMLSHVESVESFEQRMRIVSLNAAVKCSRLDHRGRALNVVAQQLRELTRDTLSVAGEAVAVLRKASKISEEFSRSLAESSVATIAELENTAIEALESLSSFDGVFAGAISALSKDVPLVKHKLNEVRIKLADAGPIVFEVFAAEERLLGFAEDTPSSENTEELLSEFRQLYTMEAERQIHDEFAALSNRDSAA